MLAYIKGVVLEKTEKTLIVLTNDLGYRISVSTDVLSACQLNQEIELYLYMSVREDDISLYGFSDQEQKIFFTQLIGVSGIGPKMGMEILSAPVQMTKQAIVNGDASVLTKIKGLGKKTAERLILELKNKIDILPTGSSSAIAAYDEDAIEALVALGYEKSVVIRSLADMPNDVKGTESVIKYFLKNA